MALPSEAPRMDGSATSALVESVAGITFDAIPVDARTVARHCLLDWFGVALGGSREPLSEIIVREAGDGGASTLVGRGERAGMLSAALINGTMSHALDFDDTHTLMSGHPSVPVVPAVLALAERDGHDGRAIVAAIVTGIETECRLGALVNPGHYTTGFHATGTLGTFGAAAAAAHLLHLDDAGWHQAMALAGTQAAGLKSGFGTMAKPLHAGRAASNGLLAALLARGGFTGNPQIVEVAQGFGATHAATSLDAARIERLRGRFLITDTLFKYHASCYLTHAAIEAALQLRASGDFAVRDIDSVEIQGSTGSIGVCDIAEPGTGLEGKFSLRATTAMALLGDRTGDPAAFSDERMRDHDLVALRDRTTFIARPEVPGTRATVVVRAGGGIFEADADTGRPATDLGAQWDKLSAKFFALATPILGVQPARQLYAAIEQVEAASSVRDLLALARPAVTA